MTKVDRQALSFGGHIKPFKVFEYVLVHFSNVIQILNLEMQKKKKKCIAASLDAVGSRLRFVFLFIFLKEEKNVPRDEKTSK